MKSTVEWPKKGENPTTNLIASYDEILKEFRERYTKDKRTARNYLRSLGFNVAKDGTLTKKSLHGSSLI